MGKRRGGYLGGSTVIGPNSPLMGGKPRTPRAAPMPPRKSGWNEVDDRFQELLGNAPEKPASMRGPGPVTIGELRRTGKLLEVGCTKCWRVAYVDPNTLPFPDAEPVPTVHRRMKCSCGEKGGYSRPDARVMGVDGKYPK